MRRFRWTLPRPGLLARFAIISGLLIAMLGVVAGVLLGTTVRERAVADAIRTGEVAASIGIRPLLDVEDFRRDFVPLEPDRLAELDAALANALSERGVVRLKVWNLQHWLIYSDNPRLLGRWFPSTDLLDASFRGAVTSEITDLSAPEEREEQDFGRLLAVYVPVRIGEDGRLTATGDGEVVGAFEMYLPYQPIAAAISADTRRLQLTLGVGLVLLYLSLYRLVAGAARRLRSQAAENLHQATHDGLTGLANRALFESELASLATSGPVAVVLLDLSDFKQINDTLGHHHGDAVLIEMANRLRSVIPTGSTLCRVGGDVFVVGAAIHHAGEAHTIARQLLSTVETQFNVAGLDLHISAACGVAWSPDHGREVGELMQHADAALYQAKESHSSLELYAPDLNPYRPEHLAVASRVRGAIERGEMVLYFQPKLDLRTGRIYGAEALVRWIHPEQGVIGPGSFMPVVEQTDLIRDLTVHLLDQAMAQCRRWRDDGIETSIAVNLSARSALDLSLPSTVEAILTRHQLGPSSLECELTESALLRNPDRARQVLGQLDRMGVRVTIDDFGTGYASLATLTTLPVSSLKIDQSFVRELLADGQGAAIVRFSTTLGQQLGMHVVAEGVEDAPTLQRLAELGCHSVQGYLIARPLPAEEFGPFVTGFDASMFVTRKAST